MEASIKHVAISLVSLYRLYSIYTSLGASMGRTSRIASSRINRSFLDQRTILRFLSQSRKLGPINLLDSRIFLRFMLTDILSSITYIKIERVNFLNANYQFGMVFKILTKSITPTILSRLIALYINLEKLSNNFHSG